MAQRSYRRVVWAVAAAALALVGSACEDVPDEQANEFPVVIATVEPQPDPDPDPDPPSTPVTDDEPTSVPTTVATSTDEAQVTQATPPLEAAPAPESASTLGLEPELQPLADLCFAGRMASCDQLLDASPRDSDYRAYGATCGGRITTSAPCTAVFLSDFDETATLIAEGVLLRSGPSTTSEALVRIDGFAGEAVAVLETSAEGWVRTVSLGQEGWIFGAFVAPPPAGFAVARDLEAEPVQWLNAAGENLQVENGSGSFALVVSQSTDLWEVVLPDGGTAFVDPNKLEILASSIE